MEIRKIIPAHEEEKKRKRNQIILGIVLVLIMVLSTLGYSFQGVTQNQTTQNAANKTEKFNGFDLVQKNGFWVLSKNDTSFIFIYNPKEEENNSADISLSLNDYRGKILYLKSDSMEAESEIRVNLRQFVQSINELQNQTCEENSVTIKESNESEISQAGNCILIKGKKEDLPRLTDDFLFKVLGIKN